MSERAIQIRRIGKDVVVTLPKAKGGLKHLQEKINATEEPGFRLYAYWFFLRLPKELHSDSRIYVVCEGYLRGYFTIYEILHDNRVIFEMWYPVDQIQMKGFQGFRYYKKEDES